jgi:carboxynorspermidine decarboxylase
MDFQVIKDSIPSSPAFVFDEAGILSTLKKLHLLRHHSGCKVLYSLKSCPFSSVLDIVKPFVDGLAVSSLFEARLAREMLAESGSIHLTTPGLRQDELDQIARLVTHLSFNSLSQHQRFSEAIHSQTSIGLRINPKLSFLKDDRFNPCRQHSKLGVDIDAVWQSPCLDQIKGLQLHTMFSATDFVPLIKTINKLRHYMGGKLAQLEWLNLGGGYLFDQIDDYRPFIDLVSQLKNDFDLDVYIEPGKAIIGGAGHLISTVLDSFVSDGKVIVILDTSINHNPEVFEYQRQPTLHEHDAGGSYPVILAGCTCLAGDIFGEYRFKKPPAIGDKVVFTQMGAYSLIKANRFNGYNFPDMYGYKAGQLKKLKHYDYQDYRRQWWAD